MPGSFSVGVYVSVFADEVQMSRSFVSRVVIHDAFMFKTLHNKCCKKDLFISL